MDGREDSLDVAKHGGEAQAEKHDEEQYGPYLRAWHLYHCLGKHNKSQAGTWGALWEEDEGEKNVMRKPEWTVRVWLAQDVLCTERTGEARVEHSQDFREEED